MVALRPLTSRCIEPAIAAALACASVLAAQARAQCDVTPPAGAVQAGDGCGPGDDSNGGCNVSPAAFTDLGTLSVGGVLNVVGQIGTFDGNGTPNSTEARDIDWMLVRTTSAGKLRLSLAARNSVNLPQFETVIYVAEGIDPSSPCPAAFDIAARVQGCPHVQELYVGSGTHLIAVTTPFDSAGSVANMCGPYRLRVELQALQYAACGASDASCVTPHSGSGCANIGCCERACALDPSCCQIAWDSECAGLAVTQCGLFAYGCAPPGAAPPNDCATSPRDIEVGQQGIVVANAGASTDGPGPALALCTYAVGKDLWYRIRAPGTGRLTLSMCSSPTIGDSVIEAYRLGADPLMDDIRAQSLPDMFVACADDTCGTSAGTERLSFATEADDYYLIRIGGWYAPALGDASTAAIFTHELDVTFEERIYTTGPQRMIRRTDTGVTLNVGISSGCISAAQPQRWVAVPWTLPASPGVTSWRLSRITAKGYTPDPPSGSPPYTNTSLHYVIWSRSGTQRPVDGDQVASGVVAFPTPYDDPGDDASDASHDIAIDVELPPGDYYLSVYASNPSCGTLASNFAWFVMAPGGISLVDSGGPYMWRSAVFPGAAGFARSTLSNYGVMPGLDPNGIYNCAFDIFGSPVLSDCASDFDDDGQVDGLDLTYLLAGWGSPDADVNGDGTTDGVDLTALLAAWGPCR